MASANASFLWTFDHPTLLVGCELLTDLVSADGTTRMRGYATANGSSVECLMESAENAARCRWRRDAQAFEGCGCETASRVACLCDHATDFTASASPPRVRPISVAELASVSLEDLMNTWKVFAVVFGMFASMMALAAAFQTRDRRAKRKLLNKFIDGDRATRMGFHAVADVWTWCIDVQEMQLGLQQLGFAFTGQEMAELIRLLDRTGDGQVLHQLGLLHRVHQGQGLRLRHEQLLAGGFKGRSSCSNRTFLIKGKF